MIGLRVMAVGFLLVLVGLFVMFGVWVLIPAGVVLFAVGVFADLDQLKESKHAKRVQSAP